MRRAARFRSSSPHVTVQRKSVSRPVSQIPICYTIDIRFPPGVASIGTAQRTLKGEQLFVLNPRIRTGKPVRKTRQVEPNITMPIFDQLSLNPWESVMFVLI
jgi:hypothetical protein